MESDNTKKVQKQEVLETLAKEEPVHENLLEDKSAISVKEEPPN